MTWPVLTALTFMPLVGVTPLLFVRETSDGKGQTLARWIALASSVLTLLTAFCAAAHFSVVDAGFQLIEKHLWMPSFGIVYHKGIDGISLCFVLLAAVLMPLSILASWKSVTKRVKEFMIALLVLETMMMGLFTSLDLVLFYVFFEGVLIPMFLIIGIWGGEGRIVAAYKFFLYTFLGSVLMLVAVFAMILYAGTSDMTVLMAQKFPKEMALWLWVAFFASFAVKTPMWPFHTWLPYAHVEAPTAGSVLLAGILLKMGGYGFIRISLQMLPEASVTMAPAVMALSVVAIIYASLVALAQTDLKKLVAYSSVAHMGYVTLGIFSLNQQGLDGAMMVMLSHGLVAGALFLCVGVVYDRFHSREIARFGGLATTMPLYAFAFMIFTLAAIGLPGTSGFVGEFLSLQGAFLKQSGFALLAAIGVVLGAAYMLWLYRRMFFGTQDNGQVKAMSDLGPREIIIFAPLIVLVIGLGLYPSAVMKVYSPALGKIAATFDVVKAGTP